MPIIYDGKPKLLIQAMVTVALAMLLLLQFGCGGVGGSSTNSQAPTASGPQHIVLVVLENKAYEDVIGSPAMPFLNSLAAQYAVATNYYANARNSLPNYFMLTTGQTYTTGASYSGTISDDNIVRELTASGKTWRAYAESIPSAGYLGGDVPPYTKVHNPFAYFSDIWNDPSQAANIVPFTQFASDVKSGSLPDFSFVIPNDQSDSHDCPPNKSVCNGLDTMAYSDQWLQQNIQPYLSSSTFQNNGLLIVVYDESRDGDTQHGGGHVPFVIAGPSVKRGYQSTTFYQHQSTLHMIMQRLGYTTFPGQAASAPDMSEFFQ